VFLIERAACKLFGVVMYGVHIVTVPSGRSKTNENNRNRKKTHVNRSEPRIGTTERTPSEDSEFYSIAGPELVPCQSA
jgi:hypothetical protein